MPSTTPFEIVGVVSRRSNGSLDIMPTGQPGASAIVLHEAALGSKALPSMGDEVTVTIATTRSAAEISAPPASEAKESAAPVAERRTSRPSAMT